MQAGLSKFLDDSDVLTTRIDFEAWLFEEQYLKILMHVEWKLSYAASFVAQVNNAKL